MIELTEEEQKILLAKPSEEPDRGSFKTKKKKITLKKRKHIFNYVKKFHPGTEIARNFLIELGYNVNICQECGSSFSVAIHHVDGDPYNNVEENLQILCKDCHWLKTLEQRKRTLESMNLILQDEKVKALVERADKILEEK